MSAATATRHSLLLQTGCAAAAPQPTLHGLAVLQPEAAALRLPGCR